VRRLKQLPPKTSIEVDVDLPCRAFLPKAYVPDMRAKIDLYRRLARVATRGDLDDFKAELNDRFGQWPPEAGRLLTLAELRIDAHQWRIQSIHLEDRYAVLAYANGRKIRQLAPLRGGRLRVVDDRSAYLPLPEGVVKADQILDELKLLLQPE
jgi:transcription-repair coupling factor (superfamily II helicase)